MDITEEVTPTLRAGMGGHPPSRGTAQLPEWMGHPAKPCVYTRGNCANPCGCRWRRGQKSGRALCLPQVSAVMPVPRPEESVISQSVLPPLKPGRHHQCSASTIRVAARCTATEDITGTPSCSGAWASAAGHGNPAGRRGNW